MRHPSSRNLSFDRSITRASSADHDWSPHGLYLLWELDAASTFTDTARPIDQERIDLYEENCVELFLVPDAAKRTRHFEIELGPFGHYFDILVDRTKKPNADNARSAALRIGTHRDEAAHRAVIEVAIESPDVIAALQPGAFGTLVLDP